MTWLFLLSGAPDKRGLGPGPLLWKTLGARIGQIWQKGAAVAAAGEVNYGGREGLTRSTPYGVGGWGPRGVGGFSFIHLGTEGSFEVSSEEDRGRAGAGEEYHGSEATGPRLAPSSLDLKG